MPKQKVVVWYFTDGKAGHENQTLGLLQALQRYHVLQAYPLPAMSAARAACVWLRGRYPATDKLPSPTLIMGAGHATHLSLLAARRARGGRSIVLMKPTLPSGLFDLCIIPEHDGVVPSAKVLTTRGVLNRILSPQEKDPSRGLILLGGPSRHYRWSDEQILEQITAIVQFHPEIHWQVASSRRTPSTTVSLLTERVMNNVDVVPHESTSAGWLPEQLSKAAQVWVSEDSVSMVYEALTAGAATGLLSVPRRANNRLTRGLDHLLENNLLTSFADWQAGKKLTPAQQTFNEAARCARWIHERWLREP